MKLNKIALSALFALALSACNAVPTPLSTPALAQMTRPMQAMAVQSTLTTESPTFYENRLRGFVYTWFSLFDSNAPHAEFLKRMVHDSSLEFRFPEGTLRNETDFRGWYDGILKNIRLASHTVNSIRIQRQSESEFVVYVDVLWRGIPYQGETQVFHASQEWHVLVSGPNPEDIQIRKYLVSAAQ